MKKIPTPLARNQIAPKPAPLRPSGSPIADVVMEATMQPGGAGKLPEKLADMFNQQKK